MPLKWRITLLTMVIMSVSCVFLVLTINLDIARIFPGITDQIFISGSADASEASAAIGVSGTTAISGIISENPVEATAQPPDDGSTTLGILTASGTAMVINDAILAVRMESIYKLIGIILLGGFISYVISSRALRPLSELNKAVKQVEANNLSSNLTVSKPQDEIKTLTLSFNQMISRLRNSFDSQKRFNANIAHELKTPLTIMKTNIDIVNTQENVSAQDYAETFQIIEKSADRMNSLIEALLDMVQQENSALDDTILLDELLSDIAEDAQRLAAPQNISVVCGGEIPSVKTQGNQPLLYRAISNVVENAIKYNHADGEVVITCSEKSGTAVILIRDTGIGISDEAKDAIFEPFYRVQKTRDGHGLGLAFAKSVIAMHGGTIRVENNPDIGSTFVIELPLQ